MTRTSFNGLRSNLRIERFHGVPLNTFRSYGFHAYTDGGPVTFVRNSDAQSRGTILGIMLSAHGYTVAERRAILNLSRGMVRPAPLP